MRMVARYRAGEPLQYVLGRWGFRRLDLGDRSACADPATGDRVGRRAAIDLAAAVPAAAAGRRPRDRVRRDRTVAGGRAAARRDDGLDHRRRATDALAVARRTWPGSAAPARNVRVAAGSWFEALPHGRAVRRDRQQPAVRGGGITRSRRAECAKWEPHDGAVRGSRRARRDPRARRRRAGASGGGRLAGARDRRRPGRRRACVARRTPASSDDRDPARTSPATTGSRSPVACIR